MPHISPMPMDQANGFVPIALFGAVFLFMILFAFLPPRRAAIASFLAAWLFLPIASYEINGLPEYSKLSATTFGILLAVVVFDFKRLFTFRPKWVDLPMVFWCFAPFISSIYNATFDLLPELNNQLGWYDGASESLDQILLWGVPYFIGRLYFTNWKELKDLAYGIIISGLVYAPFILFEMYSSPQLHKLVYGAHQHRFDQTFRFGMWRPMVFMQHGLMLAFWMMTVALLCIWMWRSGTLTKIKVLGVSFHFRWVALFFVTMVIFIVSANAWLWMLAGLFALFVSDLVRRPWPIIVMMVIVPIYLTLQSTSVWPAELTVDFATGLFGEERAQSLEYRYINEERLTEHARSSWLFGWAGHDRQIPDPGWGARAVPDSEWVIVFGKFGAFGLASMLGILFLPVLIFIYKYPVWLWKQRNIAPMAAMSIILVLYMYDFLLNAMVNPMFMLTAGGLMGTFANLPQWSQQVMKAKVEEPEKASQPISQSASQPAG